MVAAGVALSSALIAALFSHMVPGSAGDSNDDRRGQQYHPVIDPTPRATGDDEEEDDTAEGGDTANLVLMMERSR